MNNINQKNVIQKLAVNAQVPYLCSDFVSLYAACENVNAVEMNNIAQQLLDNDLYLEQMLNAESAYTIGPKAYDEATIATQSDGHKAFGDLKSSNCLNVLRKVEDPLSSTLKKVTETQDARFLCQHGSSIFAGLGSKLVWSDDPTNGNFRDVTTASGEVIDPTNWYADNDNLFFCTHDNAYQLSVHDDIPSLVQLLKEPIDTTAYGTVGAIAVSTSRQSIALGTSDCKVLVGKYQTNVNLDAIAGTIKLSSEEVQSSSPTYFTTAMHYFPTKHDELYLGASDGLYREQLSVGLQDAQCIQKPDGVNAIRQAKWFNNTLYVGASSGLWKVSKRTLSKVTTVVGEVVDIQTTSSAMYVATKQKVYKVTSTYIVEQTASNTKAAEFKSKIFSAIGILNDDVVLVGTTSGEVFYYTQLDTIYPQQLELSLEHTTPIVGIVCGGGFINVATKSKVYTLQIKSNQLANTKIVKDKVEKTFGVQLDGEVKKIFTLGSKTFIATSSKIFSEDETFQWGRSGVSINAVDAITYKTKKLIAIAGDPQSYLIQIVDSSAAAGGVIVNEVTANGPISAIDVTMNDGIVVFIDNASKATVVNLDEDVLQQTPAQVQFGDAIVQLETSRGAAYAQDNTDHSIRQIIKQYPPMMSELASGRQVNAFVADDTSRLGLIATSDGISCISSAYQVEEDGDESVEMCCGWVPGLVATSLLATSFGDQYQDVMLVGTTANGICSALLDQTDSKLRSVTDQISLQQATSKLAAAVKIDGSPNDATSIVETMVDGTQCIYAASSAGKLYKQSLGWSACGSADGFPGNLKSFLTSDWYDEDFDEDGKYFVEGALEVPGILTQQIYSTNSGVTIKRISNPDNRLSTYTKTFKTGGFAAKKMTQSTPDGVFLLLDDGSLGLFKKTGYGGDTPEYVANILTGVVDIAHYPYYQQCYEDEEATQYYIGLQLAATKRTLYALSSSYYGGEDEIQYTDTVVSDQIKTFDADVVNCDVKVVDWASFSGVALVALTDGTIWLANLQLNMTSFSWQKLTAQEHIKGAWLVDSIQMVVWTEDNKIKEYTLVQNDSGAFDLVAGDVLQTNVANVIRPYSSKTSYVLLGVIGDNIVDACTGQVVAPASGWTGYAFVHDDANEVYALSYPKDTTKYQLMPGNFAEVYTGIKHVSSLDQFSSPLLGVTSGGKLVFNKDGHGTSWDEVASSLPTIDGCAATLDSGLVKVFAWTSSKIYYGESFLDDIASIQMNEHLDSIADLNGIAIRGLASQSVLSFADVMNNGQNSMAEFCTGNGDYSNQMVLANTGICYFDRTPIVRLGTTQLMSNTIKMHKDNTGNIWIVSYATDQASSARRVYSSMTADLDDFKLQTADAIARFQAYIGSGSDNVVVAVSFSNNTTQLGSINMSTYDIVLDGATIPGIKRITSIGMLDGELVYGAVASTTSVPSIFAFDYFEMYQLVAEDMSPTSNAYAGFQIQKIIKRGSSGNFNALCRKNGRTSHLLECKLDADTGHTVTERQFTTSIDGTLTPTPLAFLCQMDDDGSKMVVALKSRSTSLLRASNTTLEELENVYAPNIVGFTKAGTRYAIVSTDGLVLFSGYGPTTTYVRVNSANTKQHSRLLANDNGLLAAADTQLEFIDSSGDATTMKAGLNGLKTIASATFDDGQQRQFYVQGHDVCQSTNNRIWRTKFTLKDASINDVHDLVVVNKNIFIFATDKGIYSTRYFWTMVPDVFDFTRNDALDLYDTNRAVYMDPALESAMSEHECIYHAIDGELELSADDPSELPLIAQLNKRFSSVDLDDLEPSWQTFSSDDAAGTTRVTNDLINEMVFGSYNDGVVGAYTSSFVNECNVDSASTEPTPITSLTFIAKRWVSGMTDLYINIPTTSSYYLNNLYGAAGCRVQPDAPITRVGKLGSCGATNGELSTHYTSISVCLDSTEYKVDQLLDIQINGNSLPLQVYKDGSDSAGKSKNLYSSYIEPSLARSWSSTPDGDGNVWFNFACFGTDAQAIHLMFYDSLSRSNAPFIRIVFDSNGGDGNMPKQKFLLAGTDPEHYTIQPRILRKNGFKNDSAGYDKIFAGWSLQPHADNYSGSDVLDGTQTYEDRQTFPTSTAFESLMQELGRSVRLTQKEEITLYAVWLTYQFSETDTRLLMNSTKEEFKIGAVGVDESTNLKGTVIIDFGD